jgi:hypothetical protein
MTKILKVIYECLKYKNLVNRSAQVFLPPSLSFFAVLGLEVRAFTLGHLHQPYFCEGFFSR